MLDTFIATLEACDLTLGRFRAYRIEAVTDLLGDWLMDVTYGRIGTRGRLVRYATGSETEAGKIVRSCLQRRATVRRRIGVGYRYRELGDPEKWVSGFAFPSQ